MGFTVQRNGFVGVAALIKSIVTDMVANGFAMKYPAQMPGDSETAYKITMEAGANVDTLHATQAWRVHFDVISDYRCSMVVASDVQLPDDGSTSKTEIGFSLSQDIAGVVGSDLAYPYTLGPTTLIVPPIPSYTVQAVARSKRINDADRFFIDRTIRIPDQATAQSYPMSYMLTISNRGFVLVVWEEGQDASGNKFSWVCVQRPVDRVSGAAMVDTALKDPVFCVYGLQDRYVPAALNTNDNPYTIIYDERWEPGIKKFVVREKDVLKPTPSVPATYDTEDSAAIINCTQQVAITEDNKYVITFPSRLNTPRYAYTHELDMIAFTSADVIAQWSAVENTVYGEQAPRTYRALMANKPNNTGMRLLVLEDGGGV